MEGLWQDLMYVLRRIRQTPGFAAMVVVTLALGIGANAAIFSVLDRLFLRAPAGVRAPAEVRRVVEHDRDANTKALQSRTRYSYPELRDLAGAAPPGVPVAGYFPSFARL